LAALLSERHPLADPALLHNYAIGAVRVGAGRVLELKMDPGFLDAMEPPESAATWRALETAGCPVVLVRGQRSSMLTREKAFAMSCRIPDCQLVEVAAAGHAVMLENPGGLHEVLARFLARIASCRDDC
jgi:pimeloyl-ACP methyl ester carboxylesterase